MTKAIMIQGTMSDAGKSIICAGLCRVFKQDGYRVAPFKSQNMALNSYITEEGLELGHAQAVQAQACGLEPSVLMNPILLKPSSDMGSQVILNGVNLGDLTAKEYYARKKDFLPAVTRAYQTLARQNDIIVIEGAGSPAEINLRQDDFVNMGMARLAASPVLLVGDIDRGGVFAQLAGTLLLLDETDRAMVKALLINKFRGDIRLLQDGLRMIEEIVHKPVAGVIPMLDIDIDAEDNPAGRPRSQLPGQLDLAVLRLPRLANFTDFAPLEATAGVNVRYVAAVRDLKLPDCILIPGSKNVLRDLLWLEQSGLAEATRRLAARGVPVWGLGTGYQMLGQFFEKPGQESRIAGLGLLPVHTRLDQGSRTGRLDGQLTTALAALAQEPASGYLMQEGQVSLLDDARPLLQFSDGSTDGCCAGPACGTSLHGFFATDALRTKWLNWLCDLRGLDSAKISTFDYQTYREGQFDLLADGIRQNLDLELVYQILADGV
jgi:adenosylcobyric acid synthase